MKSEITGITRANEGIQGISWNILGQTYVPKSCAENSFSWHATLPPGTFVPPHIHPNKDSVAAALKKGDFTSLRGGFKFNTNGYPIQDFYLTKVAKRPDGKFQTEIVQKVFANYGDRYAKDCAAGK